MVVVAEAADAIGIVGGGQLALMLAEAADALGLALHVQTPSASDPAVAAASSVVLAPLDDLLATRQLARRQLTWLRSFGWVTAGSAGQIGSTLAARLGDPGPAAGPCDPSASPGYNSIRLARNR